MNLPSQLKGALKTGVLKAGLNSLYYSGGHRLLARNWQGIGLIYMLHQVGPDPVSSFAPNRILSVTPRYLETVITQVLQQGLDVVSLDEAHQRLTSGKTGNRFVCFTFDDGYRDNLSCAYPIFKKFNLPFAIYVPSDYPGGNGELWWLALERVIAKNSRVSIVMNGQEQAFSCVSIREKWSAFNQIYWYIRSIDEKQMRDIVRELCQRHDVDMAALCKDLIMNWDEVRQLSGDPLVTIGAHNKGHYALSKLSKSEAHQEIGDGLDRLQSELGKKIEHYAYPYGDESSAGPRDFELAGSFGFKTGVTTRKGVLFEEHADHLMALPRVSLNGDYQSLKYNSVYLTGAPFALLNKFQKLNVY